MGWIESVTQALESGDIKFLRECGFYVISYWSNDADVSGKLKDLAIPREEFDKFVPSSNGTDCTFYDFRPTKNLRITISVDNLIQIRSNNEQAINEHFAAKQPEPALVDLGESLLVRQANAAQLPEKPDFFDIPRPDEHLSEFEDRKRRGDVCWTN